MTGDNTVDGVLPDLSAGAGEDEVERVARAICAYLKLDFDRLSETNRKWFAGQAIAAIAAMRVPGGEEPLAFLKVWWEEVDPQVSAVPSGKRQRIDLNVGCEPWLALKKPKITPLYALASRSIPVSGEDSTTTPIVPEGLRELSEKSDEAQAEAEKVERGDPTYLSVVEASHQARRAFEMECPSFVRTLLAAHPLRSGS